MATGGGSTSQGGQAQASAVWKWVAIVLMAAGLILTQGPFVAWANRVEPFILGMPFLYFWLTFWYVLLVVGALIAAARVWRP